MPERTPVLSVRRLWSAGSDCSFVGRRWRQKTLNAKPENVERDEIVAQSGRKGAVTIATNMAGRGTDILLGGNAEFMARLRVREALLPKIVKPEDFTSRLKRKVTWGRPRRTNGK